MMDTKNADFDRIADKFVELFLGEDGDKVVKAIVVTCAVVGDQFKNRQPAPPAA